MRTWIINVPVPLKPITRNGTIRNYLAVNKQIHLIGAGEIAIIWGGKHTEVPGIMGYGVILTDPLKPSAIPKKHRRLYDSSSLQVGFTPVSLAYQNALVPERYAYQLPSFNERQPIRINRNRNYWGWWAFDEIRIFTEEYRHLFEDFIFETYNDNHYKFAIHLARERYLSRMEFNVCRQTKLDKTGG